MSTQALRALAKAGIKPKVLEYRYVEKGGTAASAAALGLDEHQIVKTLVFETDSKAPLIVLMHGNMQVSTKALARHLGVRSVRPCAPATAEKHSGYRVGGTSPFGTRKALPIYVEATILDLESIVINAGRRGTLMDIPSRLLTELLQATPVNVGLTKDTP